MANTKSKEVKEVEEIKDCFIIMPIADAEGYPKGHFKHVYDNIIAPACELAGFNPVRADEVKQTNLIHLDILKQLIEAPIAICDLSNRNPNVLFELGIRQAFDKPVVLIQESGTPKIFDIAPLRYLEYCKEMKYHDVLSIQNELKESIKATYDADGTQGNVNSIVKLLALNTPAQLPDVEHNRELLSLDVMHAEIREVRNLLQGINPTSSRIRSKSTEIEYGLKYLNKKLSDIMSAPNMDRKERDKQLINLLKQLEEFDDLSPSELHYGRFQEFVLKVHHLLSE